MRQIEGPTFVEAVPGAVLQVPNMEQAGMQPLFAEAKSLITGPHAKLVGTLVREASRVGYPERFASIRLYCEA
jgi:hypothetical protein